MISSGLCGLVVEINRDNKSILDYFDLDKDLNDLANKCIFSYSTGNINEIVNQYPENDP